MLPWPCNSSHVLPCPLYVGDSGQTLDIRRPGRSFDMAFESLLAAPVSTLMLAGLPGDPPKADSECRQDMLPV